MEGTRSELRPFLTLSLAPLVLFLAVAGIGWVLLPLEGNEGDLGWVVVYWIVFLPVCGGLSLIALVSGAILAALRRYRAGWRVLFAHGVAAVLVVMAQVVYTCL